MRGSSGWGSLGSAAAAVNLEWGIRGALGMIGGQEQEGAWGRSWPCWGDAQPHLV